MATSDAGDASPSPEYSADLDDGDMAVRKKADLRDGEASPDKKPNGEKSPVDLKDPTRPRRKKARRACYACQRAHLTCGEYPVLRPLSPFPPPSARP